MNISPSLKIITLSLFLTSFQLTPANGEMLTLIGELKGEGSDFDEFLTNDGIDFSIERNNPANAMIYRTCSYDTPCKITADCEDGVIIAIKGVQNLDLTQKQAKNENSQLFSTADRQKQAPSNSQIGPMIHGLHLGLSFDEAENQARQLPLTDDGTSPYPGVAIEPFYDHNSEKKIRGFGFYNNGIKDIFNSDILDEKFLKKFMSAYKINGKQIDYKTFSKKFLTDNERNFPTFELIPPIPVFNTTDSLTGRNTFFIDCGNFAVIVAFDVGMQKGYLGITRQVALPQPEKQRPKGLQFK